MSDFNAMIEARNRIDRLLAQYESKDRSGYAPSKPAAKDDPVMALALQSIRDKIEEAINLNLEETRARARAGVVTGTVYLIMQKDTAKDCEHESLSSAHATEEAAIAELEKEWGAKDGAKVATYAYVEPWEVQE